MTAPTPTIPTFSDGVVVHAADLNGLGSNLTNLYNYTMAGFRTLKPQVSVHLNNTSFAVANATETEIIWDAADVNTDNMWLSTAGGQFTINTAGTYYLYLQAKEVSSFAEFHVTLCVNGTSTTSNAVGQFSATANGGNVSAILPLAVNSTIFGFVYQATGASINLSTQYGGSRMAAYWISP